MLAMRVFFGRWLVQCIVSGFLLFLLLSGCAPATVAPLTPPITQTLPTPQAIIQSQTVSSTLLQTATPEITALFKTRIIDEESMILNFEFFQTPTLLFVDNSPVIESVSYQVPFRSQEGLKSNGIATTAGCTAASAQMILDYWKQQNPENKTLSAQQLIDINTSQGTFNRVKGLSMTNMTDEFALLGYEVETFRNSSKRTLLAALNEFGPQAILVKTGWIPTGSNHLAVLTGYDSENDLVTINDPWYDAPLELTWDGFDGIWSLNYSERKDGYLVRTFFNVIPKNLTNIDN